MKIYRYIIITSIIMLPGCRSTKSAQVTTVTERNTSTTRHSIVEPDTIIVTLPPQSASEITADSVSYLSNDYAESTVRLRRDGTISHTLVSRDKSVRVPVSNRSETCDTTVTVTSQSIPTNHGTSQRWWQTIAGLALVAVIVALIRR